MLSKEVIIVSFSGGRTSGFMCHWLLENMSHIYDFIFVYANTGLEHKNTLEFVDQVDRHFNLNLVWLEAKVSAKKGDGTGHKIVTYATASRNGEPMEKVIKKYGLPNHTYIHCTREAKLQPIESYKRSIGLSKSRNAVGIRYDEFHRVRNDKGIIYPLATISKTTKDDVISYWESMPFNLKIEEHYGNCVGCYKKSDKKLKMIADENPQYFDFWERMENKYSHVVTTNEAKQRVIYRGYRSAFEVKNNINLPDNIGDMDECAEECGSVISDYISKEAQSNLFLI